MLVCFVYALLFLIVGADANTVYIGLTADNQPTFLDVDGNSVSEVDVTLESGSGVYGGVHAAFLFFRTLQNANFSVVLVGKENGMIGTAFNRVSTLQASGDSMELTKFSDFVVWHEEHDEGDHDAHEEGNHSDGDHDHEEGNHTDTDGDHDHEEGNHTDTDGDHDHEEGNHTDGSHTDHDHEEGNHTDSDGDHDHGDEEGVVLRLKIRYGTSESEILEVHAQEQHVRPPHEEIFALFGGVSMLNFTQYFEMYNLIVLEEASRALGSTSAVDEHDGHNHKKKKSQAAIKKALKQKVTVNRMQDLQRSVGTTVPLCASAIQAFNAADLNQNGMLDAQELNFASSHVFLMLQGRCFVSNCNNRTTTAEAWGYGFLSVILISLVGLLAVAFIPVKNAIFKTWLLVCLVAFAFSAIIGDTVFHIIPGLIGLHSHGEDPIPYMWLLLTVVGTAVIFFLIERGIHYIHHLSKSGESPTSSDDATSIQDGDLAGDIPVLDHDHIIPGPGHDGMEPKGKQGVQRGGTLKAIFHSKAGGKMEEQKSKTKLRDIKAMGWLNLVSDGFHNFVDGLALGAAWSTSISLGIGTSIAVLCHEIPQELGDFAILVDSGFSKRGAICWNLLSAVPAILGLLIALPISTAAASASIWFLAVTAGGFLYIGFGTLLPEIVKPKGHALTVASLVSMCLGFVALILLAVYEDSLLYGFCI